MPSAKRVMGWMNLNKAPAVEIFGGMATEKLGVICFERGSVSE